MYTYTYPSSQNPLFQQDERERLSRKFRENTSDDDSEEKPPKDDRTAYGKVEDYRRDLDAIYSSNDPVSLINFTYDYYKEPAALKQLALDDFLRINAGFPGSSRTLSAEDFVAALLKGGANPNAFGGEIMANLAIPCKYTLSVPRSSFADLLYKNGGDFNAGLKYLEKNGYDAATIDAMKKLCDKYPATKNQKPTTAAVNSARYKS
jgi:hypothetical protein